MLGKSEQTKNVKVSSSTLPAQNKNLKCQIQYQKQSSQITSIPHGNCHPFPPKAMQRHISTSHTQGQNSAITKRDQKMHQHHVKTVHNGASQTQLAIYSSDYK